MNITNLSPAQLRKAADLQEQIEKLQHQLASLSSDPGSGIPAPFKVKRGPKKGGMSAAGRARIAEAQRKRWAKINAAKGKASKTVKRAKRKMSAAGRAAIVAAQKARWAKIKAAKKA